MKHIVLTTILVALLLPSVAMSAVMSSPSYSINGASIVSGGGSSTDAEGVSKTGVAIGRTLYLPPGSTTSSPNYTSKQVAQVSPGGGGGFLHTGDINGDGVVDIVDALLALKSGVGLVKLSSAELTRGDVGPLVKGIPVGNGVIDVEDATLILRKAVGLGW
ncbi:MAG: dockerin type I repeat-containing protein [Desulfuromonadaceae bacterium]